MAIAIGGHASDSRRFIRKPIRVDVGLSGNAPTSGRPQTGQRLAMPFLPKRRRTA